MDDRLELDLDHFKRHVESFLSDTEPARRDSEKSRDYYNHQQWTEEQVAELKSRKQAPVVVNRIKPKIDGLKGLLIQRQTDPKAFPRTQEHEEAAHAVTDALRYVADNVDFDELKVQVAEDFFVEGYGGAIVEVKERADEEPEIRINQIPWDRIYFDPHSRQHDFSDGRYVGLIVWMDEAEAVRMFGQRAAEQSPTAMDGETFEDRPRWFDGTEKRRRMRIAHEFFVGPEGVWHMTIFAGEDFLSEPAPSPYVDEFGQPTNPIELVSAHMDRDNARFGEVKVWRDLQDEINHRRSKALHANSARQTVARKGAVADVEEMKRELAKVDGHVEVDTEGPIVGDEWQILPTGDMAQAQFDLLVHATAEMDAVGFNAQLAGERQGNLSGKAILALQGAGANEMASLFAKLNGWEKRIYRQIWFRVRQFWTAEKWVRVTDDKNALRWVGFNVPITLQARLEEVINDESEEEFTRKRAAEMFAQMMQAQDPRLQQPVMVRNEPAELDMDIVLEQQLDTVNVQQEQFEMLATLAQNRPEIPFTALLRLSTLRDKDDLISDIEEGEQNQGRLLEAQAEQEQMRLQAETQAKIAQDTAATENELKKDALLNQQKIEAERQLTALKAAFEREKAALAVNSGNAVEARSRTTVEIPEAERLASAMDRVTATQASDTQALESLLEALRAPRRVERDGEGRIVAVV